MAALDSYAILPKTIHDGQKVCGRSEFSLMQAVCRHTIPAPYPSGLALATIREQIRNRAQIVASFVPCSISEV